MLHRKMEASWGTADDSRRKEKMSFKHKDMISCVEKVIQRNNGQSESSGKAHLYKVTVHQCGMTSQFHTSLWQVFLKTAFWQKQGWQCHSCKGGEEDWGQGKQRRWIHLSCPERTLELELTACLSRVQHFLPCSLRNSTPCTYVCLCTGVCVHLRHTKPMVPFLSPKIFKDSIVNKNISLSHRHANVVL